MATNSQEAVLITLGGKPPNRREKSQLTGITSHNCRCGSKICIPCQTFNPTIPHWKLACANAVAVQICEHDQITLSEKSGIPQNPTNSTSINPSIPPNIHQISSKHHRFITPAPCITTRAKRAQVVAPGASTRAPKGAACSATRWPIHEAQQSRKETRRVPEWPWASGRGSTDWPWELFRTSLTKIQQNIAKYSKRCSAHSFIQFLKRLDDQSLRSQESHSKNEVNRRNHQCITVLMIYPLVNVYITMENHHFSWKFHYFYGHFQ